MLQLSSARASFPLLPVVDRLAGDPYQLAIARCGNPHFCAVCSQPAGAETPLCAFGLYLGSTVASFCDALAERRNSFSSAATSRRRSAMAER